MENNKEIPSDLKYGIIELPHELFYFESTVRELTKQIKQ